MKIIFTKHAEVKLIQRHILKTLITATLESPDFIIPSHNNRERAYKKFGKNHLEVIFIKEKDAYIVITQHWVARLKKQK